MNLMKRKMMKRLSVPAALCMLAMLLFAVVPARAAQDPVKYLDPTDLDTNGNSSTKYCTEYTVYSSQTVLEDGKWYVVPQGTYQISTPITVNGTVNLILCDGADLTAAQGVRVGVENGVAGSLTIWAQSEGADKGRLTANGAGGSAGIGGGDGGYTSAVEAISGTVIHTNAAAGQQWLLIEDPVSDAANGTSRRYHVVRRASNGSGSFTFIEGDLYELETLDRVMIICGQSDEAAKAAVVAALAGPDAETAILNSVRSGSLTLKAALQNLLRAKISVDHEISYSVTSSSYTEPDTGGNEVTRYQYEIIIKLDDETVKTIVSSGNESPAAFNDSFLGSIAKSEKYGFIKTVTETVGSLTVTKQLLLIQDASNSWTAYVRTGENGRLRDYGLNKGEGSFATPQAKSSNDKLNSLDEVWFAYLPDTEVTALIALNRVGSGPIAENGDLNGGYFKDAGSSVYHFVQTAGQDGSGGNVTINGGTVKATGGDAAGENGRSCGIDCAGCFTITGGSVTATGGNMDPDYEKTTFSYGVYSEKDVIIKENAELIASGGTADESEGICCMSGDLSVSGSAKVTAIGGEATENDSYGICCDAGKLSVSGSAAVSATGGEAEKGNSGGVFCKGSVSIGEGSSLSANGSKAEGLSHGILCEKDLSVARGGTLTARSNKASQSFGIQCASLSVSGTIIAEAGEGVTSWGISCNREAVISSGATVTATAGTATYGESVGFACTGTLTVNGTLIAAGGKVSSSGSSTNNSYGVICNGNLTVDGSGAKLTATGGTASAAYTAVGGAVWSGGNSYGIYCTDFMYKSNSTGAALTVTGGATVTAAGGPASEVGSDVSDTVLGGNSCGISCSSMNVSGSTVEASGSTASAEGNNVTGSNSYGIVCNDLTVGAGTKLTASGGTASAEGDNVTGAKSFGIDCDVMTVGTGSKLTAAGNDLAVDGTVKNQIAGAGNEKPDGTGTWKAILTSENGQELDDKQAVFPAFVLTLDPNGAEGDAQTFFAPADSAMTLPENPFSRTDKVFDGWSTEADGSVVYDDKAEITLTDHLTLYAQWGDIVYTVTEGADGSWTKGSSAVHTIVVKRNADDANCFARYVETLIDGVKADVAAASGSTVITIAADTLDALSEGTHTVTVKFKDGEAGTTLTVNAAATEPETTEAETEPESTAAESTEAPTEPAETETEEETTPPTGDDSNIGLWIGVMAAAVAGIVLIVVLHKKKKD